MHSLRAVHEKGVSQSALANPFAYDKKEYGVNPFPILHGWMETKGRLCVPFPPRLLIK